MEMLAPGDFNRKAFQELIYYYYEHEAAEMSRLVVTTGFDWASSMPATSTACLASGRRKRR